MNVSSVSSAATFAAGAANRTAPPTPAKRDNDGDYDGGAAKAPAAGGGSGRALDITA